MTQTAYDQWLTTDYRVEGAEEAEEYRECRHYFDHWTAQDWRDMGGRIRLERLIEQQNQADALRLKSKYCGGCGTRLQSDGSCPYACTEPIVSMSEEHIKHGMA